MDQATARKLFEDGGVFIFLNVPEGTEFGIDLKSWNTGDKFRGVKMVPPGLHYIFYSSVNDSGDTAPRSGFFHNFHSKEILVKKWDKRMECISEENVKEEEIVRLKDSLLLLDEFLGPYPYDIYEKWDRLSCHLSDKLVKQLTPLSGEIRSALQLLSCSDADRPRGVKTNENLPSTSNAKRSSKNIDDIEKELLPELKVVPGTELRLTKIVNRDFPSGCTASEITKHSLDKTFALENLLGNYENPLDILAEIAFTYICFLVGHSLESFEHWKKLVILLCSCDVAIKKYRQIYDNFISLIEDQIKETPEEFLADIVSNNNFIYLKLKELFRNIKESDIDGRLKTKAERFQMGLSKVYGWDFTHLDSEDEEDLPVVVENV